jgi:hypothetical protein
LYQEECVWLQRLWLMMKRRKWSKGEQEEHFGASPPAVLAPPRQLRPTHALAYWVATY